AVYVAVLSKDDPSPLAPESDDEKEKKEADEKDKKEADEKKEKDKKDGAKEPPPVKVDLEDLDQRTLALPVPPKNYQNLLAGKAGTIFLVEGPAVVSLDDEPGEGGPPPRAVHRFDLEKRKVEKLVEANALAVSQSGEKMLYRLKDDWFLVGTAAPPKPGEGALKLDGLEVRVDPRAEWRQVERGVDRVQRDFPDAP